jgi:hypothetical protein
MPQDDTAHWVRTSKLAVVAGVWAVSALAAGAFVESGSTRLFQWATGAGVAFSAIVALIDAYWRTGLLDPSRAAMNTKARKVWAGAVAAIAVAAAMCWLFGYFVLFQGFASGLIFFALLVFSPLFRPNIALSLAATPLSPVTTTARSAGQHDAVRGVLLIFKSSLVFLTIVTWVCNVLTAMAVNESTRCAGHDWLLGQRGGLSDILAPAIMSTICTLGAIIVVKTEKIKRLLAMYDWGVKFGPVSVTYGVTLVASVLCGAVVMFGFLALIAIWRHNELLAYCLPGIS